MAYATSADVAAELGGITINASTVPTSTMVDSWIADAAEEVELMTGQVYATTAITSSAYEYHDYDGSGVIRLNHWPVQSVESLECEVAGLGAVASWVSLLEGRDGDKHYSLYGEVGAVRLHPNSTGKAPIIGNQNIRACYTYGHTSVPRSIKELVTKLVAKRYITTVASNTASTGGGSISVGAISISDPTNYVYNHLVRINDDIDRLTKQVVGTLRTINYDSRLYG